MEEVVGLLSLISLIYHHLFQRAPYDHADVLAAHTPILIVELRGSQLGSSARHWMQLQMNYDLWQAEQRADELDVKRLVPA